MIKMTIGGVIYCGCMLNIKLGVLGNYNSYLASGISTDRLLAGLTLRTLTSIMRSLVGIC